MIHPTTILGSRGSALHISHVEPADAPDPFAGSDRGSTSTVGVPGPKFLLGLAASSGASGRGTIGSAGLPAAVGRGWLLCLLDDFGCGLGRRGLLGARLALAGLFQKEALLLVQLGGGEDALVGARADPLSLLAYDGSLHGDGG